MKVFELLPNKWYRKYTLQKFRREEKNHWNTVAQHGPRVELEICVSFGLKRARKGYFKR